MLPLNVTMDSLALVLNLVTVFGPFWLISLGIISYAYLLFLELSDPTNSSLGFFFFWWFLLQICSHVGRGRGRGNRGRGRGNRANGPIQAAA